MKPMTKRCLRKQIPWPNSERLRQLREVLDPDVALASFDAADVVTVQARFKTQVFL